MDIGKKLKRIRLEKKLTQQHVANKLGVQRATYTAYEANKAEPPISKLMKLAKIFEVPIEYFLYEDPPITNEIKDVKIKKIYEELLSLSERDKNKIIGIIELFKKFKTNDIKTKKEIIDELYKKLNYSREELDRIKELMVLIMMLPEKKRKGLIELIR